jgi:hypothetical protein
MRNEVQMMGQMLAEKSPRVLYDIREDVSHLEKMRKASTSKGPWGVAIPHGVVGSPEWWSAVESGQIKLETFVGTISSTDNGPMGDTLEVHIKGPEGVQSWIAWKGFEIALVGTKVCTHYVRLAPKNPSTDSRLIPVLLQVESVD